MASLGHSIKESLCNFAYWLLIYFTFGVIMLLAIPMLLSLCMMAVIWGAVDSLLLKLERGAHKRLEG